MLLHSREGSGERASVDINAMVEEALNLAYHGARAEKPGFNVTIDKSLDSERRRRRSLSAGGDARAAELDFERLLRDDKRRADARPAGLTSRRSTASTRDLGDSVEIAIRDNGTGIPDEVKAKMFNPFFTTKPAGEGTGLGLSLSHDIVVKQHGGTLEVDERKLGAFTAVHDHVAARERGPRRMSALILVVDDEPDVADLFRQQFRRELRAARFAMEFAQSAGEALKRGRTRPTTPT